MTIKVMGKSKIEQCKLDSELKHLEELQENLMDQVKMSINSLIDLDCLYELQKYIEELILDWEDIEFDEEYG
jgi:hypothetical protein